MTAIHSHTTDTNADASVDQPTPLARRVLAALRIAFGLTFLWAFFDKTFALGFHTGYDQTGQLDRFGDAAWINGGSPTEGFLAFGADGPFKGFYNSIAGAPGRTRCSCSACSASASRSPSVSGCASRRWPESRCTS